MTMTAHPMGYTIRAHPQGDDPQPATCKHCHADFVSVRLALYRDGEDAPTDFRSVRCARCERRYIRAMVTP